MSTGFHKFLLSSKFRGRKKPISWAAVSAFFSCPLSNGDVRKQQLQVCYWSCSVEAREGSEAQSSEEEESGDHCGRGIQFHWRSLDVFSDHPFSEPLLAGWQWENEGHLLIFHPPIYFKKKNRSSNSDTCRHGSDFFIVCMCGSNTWTELTDIPRM